MSEHPIDLWRKKLEHLQREEALATDPGERFKLQQQIADAKQKISELTLDQQDSNQLQKDSGRTRSNQFLESLLYFKDYLPFLGVLAALIGLIPGVRFTQPAIAALLFFSLWILYLGRKAYRTFGTTRSMPGPRALWQIIFNQLLPQKGTQLNQNLVKVLIIYDGSTESVVDSLAQEYRRSILQIIRFKYTSKFERNTLLTLLESSDAVYFFCTEAIEQNAEIYDIVNNWSVSHSDKPVLAVNFLPPDASYNWAFNLIPKAGAVSGLWQLLARATERARQWRGQADLFQRIWIWSLVVAALLCAFLYWSYFKAAQYASEEQTKLHQWEKTDSNDLIRLQDLWNALADARTSGTLKDDGERARAALKSFADYVAADLKDRQGVSSDTGAVSFWRKYEDQETKKTYFVGVARSDNDPLACNEGGLDAATLTYPSIISCAIGERSVVRWRVNMNNGEDASWQNGRVTGYWRTPSDAAPLLEFAGNGRKCRWMDRKKDRTGILCIGIAPRLGAVESGVCISTTNAKGFPEEEWTKHYLYQAISVMQLIPDELLLTKDRRDQCKNNPERNPVSIH
ncbi:MAG TPA: hypothetical protein DC054_13270 [Blastocatellia bacterium]|nr:hypothetical protein [Blastocatellia bacterium]